MANLAASGLGADSSYSLWQQDPIIYPEFGYVGDLYSDAAGNATFAQSAAYDDSPEAVATFSVRSGAGPSAVEVATGHFASGSQDSVTVRRS